MMLCIDEVLNEAIMTSTPYVIVEGIDDIAIYEGIAKSIGKTIEVAAVETLAENRMLLVDVPYTEGGEGVKKAIDDLNSLISITHPIEDYILGIIDRDVREYRNELPVKNCLLVLEMYSIESHFVCEKVFNLLFDYSIATLPEYVGVDVRREIFEKVLEELLDFYYFSLESLKLATDTTYISDFKYSFGGDAKKQEILRQRVFEKTNDLNQFAAPYFFNKNIATLRKITKGKWIYEDFCRVIYKIVSEFSSFCGKQDVVQCQFCKVGNTNKCLYCVKDGITAKALHAIGRTFVATPNLDYVRNRIAQMGTGI